MSTLQERLNFSRSAFAEMKATNCHCEEGERLIDIIVEKLDTSENREVWKRGALSALRRQLGYGQVDEVRWKEDITHFWQSVYSVLSDVEDAPEAMGDLVKSKVRLLQARVRDATPKSLEGLRERFHAAARVDSSIVRFTEADSPDLRIVFRKE